MATKPAKSDEKRALFVREYLIDRNGTRAAIAAGFSSKSAHTTAHRLLKNAKVRELIDSLEAERLERLDITADRILQETAKLAFFDPRKLFHEDGRPKSITELDAITAAAIAGMDVEDIYEGRGEERKFVGVVKKYRLADKRAALEMLGRNHKLWTDKMDLNANLNIQDLSDEQLQQLIQRLEPRA